MTFANVVSMLALFVALGGGAYAATQLPKNSVGTKQLKNDAVISSKVKNDSLTGQDVNEATLGSVPSAAHAGGADTAANATNAGHAGSADSATTAGSAASATNAGNSDHLAGKAPSDFVGSSASAGGSLSGPFSALQLKQNSVGPAEVTNNSLTGVDIAGLQTFTPTVLDTNFSDTTPAEEVLQNGHFTIHFRCLAGMNGNGGTTATITMGSDLFWNVDSTAPGGAANQEGLNGGDTRTLMSIGPTNAAIFQTGVFAARSNDGGVTGNVAIQLNGNVGDCGFIYNALGGTG
jgi:hypothetical protein